MVRAHGPWAAWTTGDATEGVVLFADLDGFKDVNDLHGHHGATPCCAASAGALLACRRHAGAAGGDGSPS